VIYLYITAFYVFGGSHALYLYEHILYDRKRFVNLSGEEGCEAVRFCEAGLPMR